MVWTEVTDGTNHHLFSSACLAFQAHPPSCPTHATHLPRSPPSSSPLTLSISLKRRQLFGVGEQVHGHGWSSADMAAG